MYERTLIVGQRTNALGFSLCHDAIELIERQSVQPFARYRVPIHRVPRRGVADERRAQ